MTPTQRGVRVISLLLTLVMWCGVAPNATALTVPTLSCRFKGLNPTLKANVDGLSASYRYAAVDGMNIWNRSTINVDIFASTYGANIKISEINDGYGYWASTTVTGCSNGYWTSARVIALNKDTMSSLTARQKRIVIQHELGHAVGLAHPAGTLWCGDPSMMYQGEAKFNCATDPIWNADVYAINAIYRTS